MAEPEFRDDLSERIIHLTLRITRQWRLISELEIEDRPTAEADAELAALQQSFAELRAERERRREAKRDQASTS